MSFCGGIVKGTLWVLNFVLFLGGLAILAAGGFMHYQIKGYEAFFEDGGSKAGIFGMAVGATVALVSFLGCCGLAKSSSCMMKTYGVLIIVLLMAEIGTGIAATIYKEEARDILTKGMKSALDKYKSETTDPATGEALVKVWDATQEGLHCCGVKDYRDWASSTGWNNTNDVPDSCCKDENAEKPLCGNGALKNPTNINTIGCEDALVTEVKENIMYVVWAGMGFGIFQLLLAIVSCVIGKRYGYYEEAQQVV